LTISLAYFGFLITIQTNNYFLLLPYLLFQLLFMYLEAIERDFSNETSNALRTIKNILLENDICKYENIVWSYQFRFPRTKTTIH